MRFLVLISLAMVSRVPIASSYITFTSYNKVGTRLAKSITSEKPKRNARLSSMKTFMTSSSPPPLTGNLVSVENCLTAYNNDAVVFVDGSWHLSPDRDGRAEYEAGPRIAGAQYFDIDQVASKGEDLNPKGLPHMMPTKTLFAKVMDGMGIQKSDHVVIYGTEGCMFIPRAWYQFRAMGHPTDKIHLMQGSLSEWQKQDGPIDFEPRSALELDSLDFKTLETKYEACDAMNVVDLTKVLSVVNSGDDADSIIIDVRGAGRFNGEVPEPRPGVRGGHMPGAYNIPFTELIDESDVTKLRNKKDLELVFEKSGIEVNTDKTIICSCGSGVLACVLAASLERCGRDPSKTVLYDGSWTEYGGESDTPIV